MHWIYQINDYNLRHHAEGVVRVLQRKKTSTPDGRFRVGTIRGQMQEIYFEAKRAGISLRPADLVRLWEKNYKECYATEILLRERRELMRQQASLAKRFKELNAKLEHAGILHGTLTKDQNAKSSRKIF
jgi:hypothetical protein